MKSFQNVCLMLQLHHLVIFGGTVMTQFNISLVGGHDGRNRKDNAIYFIRVFFQFFNLKQRIEILIKD